VDDDVENLIDYGFVETMVGENNQQVLVEMLAE
jgi:hypothetical protein